MTIRIRARSGSHIPVGADGHLAFPSNWLKGTASQSSDPLARTGWRDWRLRWETIGVFFSFGGVKLAIVAPHLAGVAQRVSATESPTSARSNAKLKPVLHRMHRGPIRVVQVADTLLQVLLSPPPAAVVGNSQTTTTR